MSPQKRAETLSTEYCVDASVHGSISPIFLNLVPKYIVLREPKRKQWLSRSPGLDADTVTQEPKAPLVREDTNPAGPLVNVAGTTLATNLYNYKIGSLSVIHEWCGKV